MPGEEEIDNVAQTFFLLLLFCSFLSDSHLVLHRPNHPWMEKLEFLFKYAFLSQAITEETPPSAPNPAEEPTIDPLDAKKIDPLDAKKIDQLDAKKIDPLDAKKIDPLDRNPQESVVSEPTVPDSVDHISEKSSSTKKELKKKKTKKDKDKDKDKTKDASEKPKLKKKKSIKEHL